MKEVIKKQKTKNKQKNKKQKTKNKETKKQRNQKQKSNTKSQWKISNRPSLKGASNLLRTNLHKTTQTSRRMNKNSRAWFVIQLWT